MLAKDGLRPHTELIFNRTLECKSSENLRYGRKLLNQPQAKWTTMDVESTTTNGNAIRYTGPDNKSFHSMLTLTHSKKREIEQPRVVMSPFETPKDTSIWNTTTPLSRNLHRNTAQPRIPRKKLPKTEKTIGYSTLMSYSTTGSNRHNKLSKYTEAENDAIRTRNSQLQEQNTRADKL